MAKDYMKRIRKFERSMYLAGYECRVTGEWPSSLSFEDDVSTFQEEVGIWDDVIYDMALEARDAGDLAAWEEGY